MPSDFSPVDPSFCLRQHSIACEALSLFSCWSKLLPPATFNRMWCPQTFLLLIQASASCNIQSHVMPWAFSPADPSFCLLQHSISCHALSLCSCWSKLSCCLLHYSLQVQILANALSLSPHLRAVNTAMMQPLQECPRILGPNPPWWLTIQQGTCLGTIHDVPVLENLSQNNLALEYTKPY